ncbi:MAG: hypothetical protein Q7W05_14170 [Deltaproteobacteria bacterium]|nr:hypothetical protein [Deltaproteobacteria bacterium]
MISDKPPGYLGRPGCVWPGDGVGELLREAGGWGEGGDGEDGVGHDIYATLRSRIQDGTIELLDHRDSLRELRALELENLPGGGTRIGHPRHGHDDYADAMALAVSEARYGVVAACCASEDEDDGWFELRGNYDRPLFSRSGEY